LLVAAFGAAIAIFAIAAPAAPAAAAPVSACTAGSGVTVIVDFTHFGRAIERGCAAGHPDTALTALQAAGFETAGTANYGDAFVCRIEGLPSPKSEACVTTPPGDASWSFYFARPTDRAWTYSTRGVTSVDPAPGTVLAFAFGNYAKPSVLPSGAVATHPTTTSTTSPPPTVPASSPRVGVASGPSVTEPAAGPTTPSTPTPAVTTSTSSRTASSAPVRFVDRGAAPAVPHDRSGSPIPALLTVVLVATLGAGALMTVRNRRGRSA